MPPHIAGDNQFLLRACERDIQNAQFFSEAVALYLVPHGKTPERYKLTPVDSVDIVNPKTQIAVNDHGALRVFAFKRQSSCRPADKTNRELQSFTLMDGHDADDIRVFIQDIRLSVINFSLPHLINITDEIEKSGERRLLEVLRAHDERLQICPALSACRKRRDIVVIPGLRNQLLQQRMNRHGSRAFPPRIQKAKKCGAFSAGFGVFTCIRNHRVQQKLILSLESKSILSALPLVRGAGPAAFARLEGGTDSADFIFRKAAKISPQRSIKRNILPGIVDDPQQLQNFPDFLGCEVSGLIVHIQGNSLQLENLAERVIPASARTQQNYNVAVSHRTELPRLFVGHELIACHPADALRHGKRLFLMAGKRSHIILIRGGLSGRFRGVRGGFPGVFSGVICILIRHTGNQQQFRCIRHPFRQRRIDSSGFQFGGRIIIDAADFPPHDLPENSIDCVQHFGTAPEILIKVDSFTLRIIRLVGVKLPDKDLRAGVPETVDALFDIADHKPCEAPIRLTRNRR